LRATPAHWIRAQHWDAHEGVLCSCSPGSCVPGQTPGGQTPGGQTPGGQTKRHVAQLAHPTAARSPRAEAGGSPASMLRCCARSTMGVQFLDGLEEAYAR
jgi:hypothetical protein